MSTVHLGVKASFDGSEVEQGLTKTSKEATKATEKTAIEQVKSARKTSAELAKELNKRLNKEKVAAKSTTKAVKKSATEINRAKRAAYKNAGKAFYGYRTRVLRGIVQMKRGFTALKAQAQKTWIGKKAMSGLGAAGGAMIAAAGVGAIGSKMKGSMEMGKSIQDNAKAVGITAEAMQEWDYIFSRAGLETQDVSDAFATLADRSEDAMAGAQSMVDDFALVGISVDDLRSKKPDELFQMFADGVRNSSDQNKALASVVRTLGDDLGRRLIPMLKEGSGGLTAMKEEARGLGIVMSGETIDSLAKMDDSVTKFKKQWNAEWGEITAGSAKAFQFGDKEADYVEMGMSAIFGAALASWDKDVDFGDAIRAAAQKNDLDMDEARLKSNMLATQKALTAEEDRQIERKRVKAKIEEGLAKKQEERMEKLQSSMGKLKDAEFRAMSPAQQKDVLEKKLKVARQEERAAIIRARIAGSKPMQLLDPVAATESAQALADARLGRMGLESQLKQMGPQAGAVNVGQDQLARLGMFRGFQTEKAILQNRAVAAAEATVEQAKQIAANTKPLVNP
tara:strand:+ start:365 stop:2062 length:1698 start_codon:yes stop_codon:yes gene_type:complete